MPSKFRVRHIFRPLVNLIAKLMSRIGIKNPDIATAIMLTFAILSFISLVFFLNLFLFGIFIFLTGIFDGVDGSLSRLNDRQSLRGAVLDSVMDRFSEFIIFLALFLFCYEQLLWNIIDMKIILFIALLASLMISYTRARADNFFKGDFDIGLMARSERLFFLFIASIIAFFWGFMNELLFIYMWLVVLTGIFRYVTLGNLIQAHEESNPV